MKREKMPRKRKGTTYSVTIAGNKVHFRTGEYPDGRIGEVYIDVAKAGSEMEALYNIIAILVSKGLQHSIPLADFIRTMKGHKIMPFGKTDDPEVPECSSILDYVFRKLEREYGGSK